MFKIINETTGEQVNAGQKVQCFRGETHTLCEFYPPKHSASTGRVVVETSEGYQREYFPSVFGLKIIGEWEDAV